MNLDAIRQMHGLFVRAAAERERELARARAILRSLGIEASTYRDGILIAESDRRHLVALATYPAAEWPPTGDRFASIPIYTAPDWTFDPGRIAFLRLRVTVLDSWARPFLRALARWFR